MYIVVNGLYRGVLRISDEAGDWGGIIRAAACNRAPLSKVVKISLNYRLVPGAYTKVLSDRSVVN